MSLKIGGSHTLVELDESDPFESTLVRLFRDRVRDSDDFARRLWSSLTNITWHNKSVEEYGYSFRAAGDLIAAMRGEGCYVDWYCCAPAGVVDEEVKQKLGAEGWTYVHD